MRAALIVVLSFILFGFGSVYAQGFYIGAGIGNTFIATEVQDIEDNVTKLDENATGWKAFAGVTTPTIFGIEGGYRSLGTVTYSDFEFESKTTGWDVYGMAHFEILGLVDLFAKAGVLFWKTESSLVADIFEETGTDFAWGVGAGVGLGPIGVRLEFESFQVKDPVSISMLSLSATFGF
jgi:hypothetical protein